MAGSGETFLNIVRVCRAGMPMDKVVECVPNFSEGRDKAKIKHITDAISAVDGAVLLDVDPGADTNRTVVTLVGPPEAVAEAAFQSIRAASEVIDMTGHSGAHPRMGACDVCPFVPVRGITMEECADIARRVGERVGTELGIPVYLYEHAASSPKRKNLADIRTGEYEGLADKLKNKEWKPDFGPATFNDRSGATVIGARAFLIAYNVNLNTTNAKLARRIGGAVREKGLPKYNEFHEPLRNKDGSFVWTKGRLKGVKAIGWYIEEYGCAQVSINITDHRATPVHVVYEACREEAEKLGVVVTGSEVVGLVPEDALLAAGRYYLERQGRSTSVPRRDQVTTARQSLGLDSVAPFDPDMKVVEYRLPRCSPLMDLSAACLVEEVSRDTVAPGGGSVAALAGALGAGLASMVDAITAGKPRLRDKRKAMLEHGAAAHALRERLVDAVDRDTEAFNCVITAMRMPKATEEERAVRSQAIQDAYKEAANVPLTTLRDCRRALAEARFAAEKGHAASISDAGVGALAAFAGVEGAAMNVLINLKDITDEAYVKDLRTEVEQLRVESREDVDAVTKLVFAKIGA